MYDFKFNFIFKINNLLVAYYQIRQLINLFNNNVFEIIINGIKKSLNWRNY